MAQTSEQGEPDAVAQLARVIYEQMDVEPRRMTVAIELAKDYLGTIQRFLVEQGLRMPAPSETD